MSSYPEWADPPRCHNEATRHHIFWRDPQRQRVYRDTGHLSASGTLWRTCSWCGSMHPGDLLTMLTRNVALSMADNEYGEYPHKIWVDGLPNSHAGRIVRVGEDGDGVPHYGIGRTTTRAKFYPIHLTDALNEVAFRSLADKIEERLPNGVWERFEDGNVGYRRLV